jgi:cytoskeletal protein RodZ
MEQNILIGTLLKNTRENQNISLEEISQKTKININILKSLELSDLDKLPNKTYVRGFVTNYARAVGLSVDEAKESLENSYDNGTEEAVKRTTAEVKVKTVESPTTDHSTSDANASVNSEQLDDLKDKVIALFKEIFSKKVIISVSVILVFAVVGKGVVSFMSQLNSEQKDFETVETEEKSKIILKSVDANILEMEATKKLANQIIKEEEKVAKEKELSVVLKEAKKIESNESKEATKVVKQEQKVEITKKEIATVTPKVVEAKKIVPALQNGELPFRRFYKAPTKTFQVLVNAPENQDVTLLPPNIKAAALANKQNVYIVAHDGDTWISYKKDDQPIRKFVLKQGRRVLIKGDTVLVFLGNMNVTKIFYNNNLISAQTKTGVKSLIFPQEMASQYELPLFPSYKGIQYNAAEYKEKMAPATVQ